MGLAGLPLSLDVSDVKTGCKSVEMLRNSHLETILVFKSREKTASTQGGLGGALGVTGLEGKIMSRYIRSKVVDRGPKDRN